MSTGGTQAAAIPTPTDAVPALSRRQILTIMAGLMLGMLVAALSQTIAATALPTIVGELGGQDQLSWVVSATLLATTASTPVWGKLSDLWGRKLLFQAAVVVFTVGSVASGLAQDMPQLIAFRAVQGVGIGGLIALTQATLGDVVAPRERGRYQGLMGTVFGFATVAGPLIGGFLVDRLSWRWCFYVVVPIAVAALVVTERVLNLPFTPRHRKIDWLGAVLIVGGVSAVLLVVSLGGKEFAWTSAPAVLLTAGAVVLLALAVWWERRAEEPIMPPRLFRNHTFVVAALGSFAAGISMFGAIVYLPQYLQIVKGASPTASGLLTLPLVLGLAAATTASGQVITRTGRYKVFPVIGMTMVAVGLWLMSRLDAATSTLESSLSMLVTGLGLGLVIQVLILAVQNAVERADLGTATSGATFFRSMGGALGVAMFGALLTHQITTGLSARLADAGTPLPAGGAQADLLGSPAAISALPDATRDVVVGGFVDGLHTVYLAAVPIAVVGLIVVLFLREQPLRTASDQGAAQTQSAALGAAPGAAPGAAGGAGQTRVQGTAQATTWGATQGAGGGMAAPTATLRPTEPRDAITEPPPGRDRVRGI